MHINTEKRNIQFTYCDQVELDIFHEYVTIVYKGSVTANGHGY